MTVAPVEGRPGALRPVGRAHLVRMAKIALLIDASTDSSGRAALEERLRASGHEVTRIGEGPPDARIVMVGDLPMLAAALVAYNIITPLAPIKTRANYPDGAWAWRLQNGIKDERGHYHQITNVLFYAPFRTLPDHLWYREGLSFRNGSQKV